MKPFIDTNIVVHAQTAGPKAEICQNLMNTGGLISIQVLNEFANVLRRKLMLGWEEIGTRIADVLAVLPDPMTLTFEDQTLALSIAARYQLSIYDSLIVATALRAGCTQILSEDMQHGQFLEGLEIINPFRLA